MPFFKWSNTFSLSMEEMDKDHQTFLSHLGRLYNDLDNPKKSALFEKRMGELEQQVREHFHREEKFLCGIDYPGLTQQTAQHDFFKKELQYCRLSAKQASQEELRKTLEFMRDWFLRHIIEFDKDYAKWLQDRQVH